ncbi:MAG: hypothetical protein DHS20C18_08260 [Saprospiraceae bacterium]|nr:MAG: hypothetical protein DHS20C18_08260 [Saprospiraceae bacterium]
MLGLLLSVVSCSIDEQVDPNAPSLNSVLKDASITELNLLATGIEGFMRNGFGTYVTSTGSIARELYIFDADPRNTEDLLGKDGMPLDNNTFYLTTPYNNFYRDIKTCNILLESIDNTDNPTQAEKDGYRGFANTIKAFKLFQVLTMLNDNGIRVDVADPNNLGPFLSKADAFRAIRELLDDAQGQLNGSTFAFQLSAGFAGFDTPATFSQFNRAIAARVALYAKDYLGALSALDGSFFDLMGDFKTGPKHVFSTNSGDILNPAFKTPNQSGDQLVVHNDLIADAQAGDDRLNKFALRTNQTTLDGLAGSHETRLYASATSSMDIIRNEELILIYAEGKIQTDMLGDAADALDIIRTGHSLPAYSGPMTKEALIDEMLYNRRYSFWGEGHRMFDMRRYDRLNDQFLPIDRAGDQIFTQFPIPLTEGQ